jgi:enolase
MILPTGAKTFKEAMQIGAEVSTVYHPITLKKTPTVMRSYAAPVTCSTASR